jgi:hypothetical protein
MKQNDKTPPADTGGLAFHEAIHVPSLRPGLRQAALAEIEDIERRQKAVHGALQALEPDMAVNRARQADIAALETLARREGLERAGALSAALLQLPHHSSTVDDHLRGALLLKAELVELRAGLTNRRRAAGERLKALDDCELGKPRRIGKLAAKELGPLLPAWLYATFLAFAVSLIVSPAHRPWKAILLISSAIVTPSLVVAMRDCCTEGLKIWRE